MSKGDYYMDMFASKENFKEEYKRRMLERFGVDINESHVSEQYTILGEMV